MKKIKFILTIFSLFLFIGTSFSQSAKMLEKAAEKVEALDAQIVSADADAALSDEQKEQITQLYAERTKRIRKVKKGDGTEEEKKTEIKAIRKEINKKVNKEILTKAQRQAKKAGKAKKG